MSKVTSKLQVTIPKAIADKYRIRPGDEVRWESQALGPLMVHEGTAVFGLTQEDRLAALQEFLRSAAEDARQKPYTPPKSRGWTREDLYEPPRGLPR